MSINHFNQKNKMTPECWDRSMSLRNCWCQTHATDHLPSLVIKLMVSIQFIDGFHFFPWPRPKQRNVHFKGNVRCSLSRLHPDGRALAMRRSRGRTSRFTVSAGETLEALTFTLLLTQPLCLNLPPMSTWPPPPLLLLNTRQSWRGNKRCPLKPALNDCF